MAFTADLDEIVEANGNGLLGKHPTWGRVRLKEVARVQNGAPFKSAFFNTEGRGVPLLRIRDVTRGSTETYYEGPYDNAFLVRPGDLIIGMDGDFNHALWKGPEALLNQRVCRLIVDDDAPLLKDFAFYALRGYLEAINEATPSVTVKHLSSKTVGELPLPLPPVEEQRRIVGALTASLAELAAATQRLADISQSVASMRAGILALVVQEGRETTLGELLERVEAGKSFRCHGHPAPDGRWGVIKVSAMTWGSFRAEENKEVMDEGQVDARWEINDGDLLLSRANTTVYVGASVVVQKTRPRLLLSDKSLRLILMRDRVVPEWLRFALEAPSSRAQMSTQATGTSDSMRNLSQEKLKGIRLRVPPLARQQELIDRIANQLEAAQVLQQTVKAEQAASKRLERALIFRLLTGRASRPVAPSPSGGKAK